MSFIGYKITKNILYNLWLYRKIAFLWLAFMIFCTNDVLASLFLCSKWDIAQATDQKVEYSKHKGLADKKCEALLLESLKDHGSLTKKEIVRLLWDVLPDQLEDKQKINKIDYILKRLRTAEKILNKTKGSNSVWSLGKI